MKQSHLTKADSAARLPLSAVAGLTATGVTAMTAGQAEAAIFYTPIDEVVSLSEGNTVTPMYPETGVANGRVGAGLLEITASDVNGITGTKPGSSTYEFAIESGTPDANGFYPLTALDAGVAIGPDSGVFDQNFTNTSEDVVFVSADGTEGAFTPEAGVKYVGFNHTNASISYFGWLGFETLGTGQDLSARITGIAVESEAGVGIAAGDTGVVPEPAGLAALAMGALALGGRPKRQA